jgi:hypothetical protein
MSASNIDSSRRSRSSSTKKGSELRSQRRMLRSCEPAGGRGGRRGVGGGAGKALGLAAGVVLERGVAPAPSHHMRVSAPPWQAPSPAGPAAAPRTGHDKVAVGRHRQAPDLALVARHLQQQLVPVQVPVLDQLVLARGEEVVGVVHKLDLRGQQGVWWRWRWRWRCVVCGGGGGVWCVVCGVWCVVCGVWCVVCGGSGGWWW